MGGAAGTCRRGLRFGTEFGLSAAADFGVGLGVGTTGFSGSLIILAASSALPFLSGFFGFACSRSIGSSSLVADGSSTSCLASLAFSDFTASSSWATFNASIGGSICCSKQS